PATQDAPLAEVQLILESFAVLHVHCHLSRHAPTAHFNDTLPGGQFEFQLAPVSNLTPDDAVYTNLHWVGGARGCRRPENHQIASDGTWPADTALWACGGRLGYPRLTLFARDEGHDDSPGGYQTLGVATQRR